MELSKRLEMVAGLVTQERIADIGTDHGYVPIYLYKQGRIKKAYACDVRKGPLEKCKKNIALYGAEDVIETRLGSGLTPLRPGEAETAIMAGMGGMLIVHILQDSPAGAFAAARFRCGAKIFASNRICHPRGAYTERGE